MRAIEHRIVGTYSESSYEKWARGAFLVYLFFTFFGTSAPFPDFTSDPRDIETSNPLNQLQSLLFVVSMASLVGKQEQVRTFVRTEKYLTLLLAWCLLSVAWSPYPIVSIKRWIGLFGEVIICLAALLHFRWSEEALRYFRPILFLYIPLSILAVLFIHEATQWEFPAWRGLAPTKNNLGQITLFSIVLWCGIIPYNRKRLINLTHYAMLALTVILFIGARSTTSYLAGLVTLGVLVITRASMWLEQPLFTRVYTTALLTGMVLIGTIIVVGAPDLLASFFGLFGKDLTFTGRVDLWQTVIAMNEGKFLTGWGIGGFWVMDSPHLVPLFETFPWLPNQAHEGYIDMLSQTGLVGLSLLLVMIAAYFRRLGRLKKGQVWKWLVISLLVFNLQESVFFRPRHIGHFMFVFAYIALHVDLMKEQGGNRWMGR